MTPRAAFWKWTVLGGLMSVLLLIGQSSELGGVEALLQVGEDSALRPVIEAKLGPVPLAEGHGHDGHIYYAIGLDLNGDEIGPLVDHPVYRYRRILHPLLASGFGLLGGEELVAGMVIVVVVSAAAAAGVTASLARKMGRSDWLALGVVLNPGVWLSVRLLTGDVLALALMLGGLWLLFNSPRSSTIAFTLSVLAKDVYLMTPAGLAMGSKGHRWPNLVVPAGVLALWVIWLLLRVGGGLATGTNLGLPFVGIADASSNWATLDATDLLYLVFALSTVLVGLVYASIRRGWLRWPIAAWSLLGVGSSASVWNFGNNSARAFAPILVLLVLAVAAGKEPLKAVDGRPPSDTVSVSPLS